jgi:putative salt-induced outer membrane protein
MSKRLAFVLSAAAVAVLAAPLAAFAQATTPQPTTTPPPPPPKHELTAEAAFVGLTGNTTESTLSAGVDYITRPGVWTIKNRFNVVRGEGDGVLTSESWLAGIRGERPINSRMALFGEYAFFRDRFAGIDARNAVTGGLMFKLVTTARHTLSADVGAGYLDEQRMVGDDVSTATYALGAAYKVKLSENADITDEFRFLGSFDNADDWRLSNTVAVTARLTSIFSLKFSNTVRQTNLPVPGFEAVDTITSVALVASLKRPKP